MMSSKSSTPREVPVNPKASSTGIGTSAPTCGPSRKKLPNTESGPGHFSPIRILDLLPLSHMFGQSQGLFIPLFLEGSVAFTSEIHPGKVIHFIHDNRISVVVCVPRILENLKNEVERRGIKAARVSGILRTMWRHRGTHRLFGWKFWSFVVGGAFVDRELEEFWKALGFAVIQGYGLTEASPVVAVNHPFDVRTGSLGKVVEGQDVQIAPDGEILVRGESVTTRRCGCTPATSARSIRRDGCIIAAARRN